MNAMVMKERWLVFAESRACGKDDLFRGPEGGRDAQDREEKHRQKQEYMRASDTQIAGMKRMQRGRR